jgi:hypothetical protein
MNRVKAISWFCLFAACFTFQVLKAEPLWVGNMEEGNLNDWYEPGTRATPGCCNGGGRFNSGRANSRATQNKKHTGDWGIRMRIHTPNSPASGTRLFRWREPQNYPKLYYSVWYYFPRRYTVTNGWNVFQWKSKSPLKDDPFFILNVGNRPDGSMFFYLYDWQRQITHVQSVENIPISQWFQVEAYYECAGDSTGRVTFWQDGTLLFDVPNVQTRYEDGDCQWSVNSYSDSLQPGPRSTIYVDDASISTTRIGHCQ